MNDRLQLTYRHPSFERVCQDIGEWMQAGNCGAAVIMPTRHANRATLNTLMARTIQTLGQPAISILLDATGELGFKGHALTAKWLREQRLRARPNTPGARLRLFTTHLWAEALQKAEGRVVIVVDGAQHLNRDHYAELITCDSRLRAAGCQVFTLLFGDTELRVRGEAFIRMADLQVVSRFFGRTVEWCPAMSHH